MRNIVITLILFSAFSCDEKPKEVVSVEDQPYLLASRQYCEKAEAALKAWAEGDFESWASYFTDEVEFNYPRGPRDSPFQTDTLEIMEEAAWYKNWFKVREITEVAFNPISSIAFLATEENPFYANSGVFVISITSMEISIYGAPVKAGTCYIHHFNEDGLIDQHYFIQDIQNQMDALNY